jgi:hypothetical protein
MIESPAIESMDVVGEDTLLAMLDNAAEDKTRKEVGIVLCALSLVHGISVLNVVQI